jgi:hypothetical protein
VVVVLAAGWRLLMDVSVVCAATMRGAHENKQTHENMAIINDASACVCEREEEPVSINTRRHRSDRKSTNPRTI